MVLTIFVSVDSSPRPFGPGALLPIWKVCGALASALIYIYMDSQKQLKLCRFPQRTCKLMQLKVVIWILIAARSWQWAVVARNKQNFTFISFNAGTVKKYTVTWIIFILPPWRESIIRYGRNREFTLILSVNSRLYVALIHAYSIHESTLIQCVNLRLFDAWMYAYTER